MADSKERRQFMATVDQAGRRLARLTGQVTELTEQVRSLGERKDQLESQGESDLPDLLPLEDLALLSDRVE